MLIYKGIYYLVALVFLEIIEAKIEENLVKISGLILARGERKRPDAYIADVRQDIFERFNVLRESLFE